MGARRRPTATWVSMVLALIVLLMLPDWTGSGGNRPVWLLLIPIALGLLGAAFAVHARNFWWGLASALWGFVLVQGLIVAITLVSGP